VKRFLQRPRQPQGEPHGASTQKHRPGARQLDTRCNDEQKWPTPVGPNCSIDVVNMTTSQLRSAHDPTATGRRTQRSRGTDRTCSTGSVAHRDRLRRSEGRQPSMPAVMSHPKAPGLDQPAPRPGLHSRATARRLEPGDGPWNCQTPGMPWNGTAGSTSARRTTTPSLTGTNETS
jgi:hypothetical protein